MMRSRKGSMMGPSEYAQLTWLTSPNHDLASVSVLGMGKLDIASSMDLEGVLSGDLQTAPCLGKIETFLYWVWSCFFSMEEEIKGVIEGTFDVGVIELGVIYYFYFPRDVFYYFIIPSGVGIARCKVALWHP